MKKLIVVSYNSNGNTKGTNTFTFDSNNASDGEAVNNALDKLNKKYPKGLYIENIWVF